MSAIVPRTLEQLESSELEAEELRQLRALRDAGLPLAPLVVVPAALEERFYTLNNLPHQLNALFAHLDLFDPDEDDIEELAPEAERLLLSHYLLDEAVDAFYQALEPLPPHVRLRRAGDVGREVVKGRPALLALKHLWADAWRFEALMARLEKTAAIALEARPALLHPADEPAEADLAARVAAVLGTAQPVFVASAGGITRLVAA